MTTLAEQAAAHWAQLNTPVSEGGLGYGSPAPFNPSTVATPAWESGGFVSNASAGPVAEAEAVAARAPGFFSKFRAMPATFGAIKNAGSLSEALAAAKGLPGGPVGIANIAAQLAGPHIGNFVGGETNNPEFGNLAESVLKGSAAGAGLGLMGGPFSPVTVPLGAAGGGAVAALAHLWGHRDSNPGDEIANQTNAAFGQLAGMGIPPETLAAVRQEYEQLNAQNPQAAMSYLSKVAESAQTQSPFSGMPGIVDPDTGMDAKSMLALQEQTTQLMAPYMERLQAQGTAEINAWQQAATPEGQHINKATRDLANVYKGNLGQVSNAYILQAQGQPFLNALASSTYRQGVAAQQQGGSGGGGLADLLTQSATSQPAFAVPQ